MRHLFPEYTDVGGRARLCSSAAPVKEMDPSRYYDEDSPTPYGVFGPPPIHFVQTRQHLLQITLQLMAHPMLG